MRTTGAPRKREVALLTTLVLMLLGHAAEAGATLRDTPLENSCTAGYTYGEHTFANWTVEGCSKAGTLLADEKKRRLFRGNLEVNGMVFEISDVGPDLTATEDDNDDDADSGTLKRTTTSTIVFDPLVGGARKRFVIYTGAIDLTTTEVDTGSGPDVTASAPAFGNLIGAGPKAKAASGRPAAQMAATVGIGTDYVDIPTSGTPKLFGLAIKDGIKDAAVRPQNGAIPATTEFDTDLGLSTSGVSDLLDVNGDEEITLTDGTGMEVTNLRLDFPDIEVPGIGGLEDFFIKYKSASDSWEGGLDLDLGSLFPLIEFEVEVSASDGKVLYIKTDASNLPPIPIGATGIILDSVSFEFGLDPLLIAAGAGATAGPTIAGTALILLEGDVRMEFEPNFRLEVAGGARVLPSGSGELASGGFEFIYDADGLIAVSGDARFEATILGGVGIGAQIAGSGAYSTVSNRFNIEASASGDLLLGFLGDFEVARFEAVVSSNGFGTCGKLLGFLSGGIGQEWGERLMVFTACDLSPFDAPIAGTRVSIAQNGERMRRFDVAPGTRQVAVELTADQAGPHVLLRAPDGSTRVVTTAGDRRVVGADTVVLGRADANQQLIALRNPPPGRWTVAWRPGDPEITGLRIARDVPALEATAEVSDRSGAGATRRRVRINRTSALGRGEQVQYAIRTPRGLQELGPPTAAPSPTFDYDEHGAGKHEVVAFRLRDGVPIATSRTVVARYQATFPSRPVSIDQRRRGTRLSVLARLRRGTEAPDAWQYRFDAGKGRAVVYRGRVGKRITISVPRRIKRVRVAARPVVRGRALR